MGEYDCNTGMISLPAGEAEEEQTLNIPAILETKYAYHALLWLLQPDLVLDIGSMDGSDSKRFRKILARTDLVAFEGNPGNYNAMVNDVEIQRQNIRVVNSLVADGDGERSLFVQQPRQDAEGFNRGTSSMTRREEAGAKVEEVRLKATRVDSFLAKEYPLSSRIALWIDVEGHTYSVLAGIRASQDRIKLMHAEVETIESWPGQKLEPEVLELAARLGFVPLARSAHSTQRDVIFVNQAWYESKQRQIHTLLHLCSWAGSPVSKVLAWLGRSHRRGGTPSTPFWQRQS